MKWINTAFAILSSLFGNVQWTPPQWLQSFFKMYWQSPIGLWQQRLHKKIKKEPKKYLARFASGFALLIGVITGGYYAYDYYQSLPKPDYASVSISAPRPNNGVDTHLDKIIITFGKSVAPLELIGQKVKKGVRLRPEVKGYWSWSEENTLVFTPEGATRLKTDWAVGKEYIVQLDRSLFPSHILLEDYQHSFRTADLDLHFTSQEFYIDSTKPDIKKIVATLQSNLPMNSENIKKHISITLSTEDDNRLSRGTKTLSTQFRFNEEKTKVYIESSLVTLTEDNQIAKVTISKGVESFRGGRPSQNEVQTSVRIPGKYTALQISDANIIFARNSKYEPEQILVLNTGARCRSEDVLAKMKVYLLPSNHVAPGRAKKVIKNYRWNSASEVTAEVRKKLKPIKLKLLPTPQAHSASHSFKIDIPDRRNILIEIEKGINGLGGFVLGKNYSTVLRAPQYKPELLFMSEGSILPLTGDKKLPLLSRSLQKVKFNIGRILPEQMNFFIAKLLNTNDFSEPPLYSQFKNMTMQHFKHSQLIPAKNKKETVYFSLDLAPYITNKKGFFYIHAHGVKPQAKEKSSLIEGKRWDGYFGNAKTRRLILVTDLGLIAKKSSSGETHVFLQNLKTGRPMADARISVIGQNGLSLFSQQTGAQGFVTFPKLDDFYNEKRPLAFVASKNGDIAYLPYNMRSRELNYSRFDTSGIQQSNRQGSLYAMLFSDRKLYRPGDKINIGYILRAVKTPKTVGKLPLTLKVTDPRGNTIKTTKKSMQLYNLQDFSFSTNRTSPTGNYSIELSLTSKSGKSAITRKIGQMTVKVEEFVPDKLKITTQLSPFTTNGWSPLTEDLKASVRLKNLFGSPAQDRKIKASLVLTPTRPYIKAYKSYHFSNPNSDNAHTATEPLTDTTTNSKGLAEFSVDLSKYKGFYSVKFNAEGFEAESGRSVQGSHRSYYSNLNHIVGFKHESPITFIKKDAKRAIQLIALNSEYKPDDIKAKAQLIKIEHVSTLVRADNGTYKYKSVKKENEVNSKDIQIKKSGLKISLPTAEPGDYKYIITSNDGAKLNQIEFSVAGEKNLSRSLERTAELQLSLDKTDYTPGDTININIRGPYKGAGLITIEREQIYAQKWFSTNNNSTVQSIRIPEGLTGNAYINVTLLRAHDSKEIYTSPLSYGIAPFSINLDKHKTEIQLDVPERVRPGDELKIKYSTNRATSIIIYGVDEGILQVAKYKLPNPLKYFFKKRALQVQTYQLLDLLLPDYSVIEQLSASGGGAPEDNMAFKKSFGGIGGRNLNPFQAKGKAAVVFWSKPLQANKNQKTFSYKIPQHFNGALRVMAVASSKNGLGSTQVATVSRGDFIITPTAPIFLTPSDEITMGVSVSNQIEGTQAPSTVKLSLKTEKGVEVLGNKNMELTISPGGETSTSFSLKATNNYGTARLDLVAQAGKYKTSFDHEISIRPAVAYTNTLQAGLAESLPLSTELKRVLSPEYGEKSAMLSASPLSLISGLISYLNDFPYGCTEQIVSKTVPTLLNLAKNEKIESAKQGHKELISVLRTRQTSSGGFSLYTGSVAVHVPASLYVIDYLTEANSQGLHIPADMLRATENFLQSSSLRTFDTLHDVRHFAHALYLQARAEIVPTNDLNYLREVLEKNYKGKWEQTDIPIYMAGVYSIIKKEKEGWNLIKDFKIGDSTQYSYFHYQSPALRDALLVNMVARHYPKKLSGFINNETFKSLSQPLVKKTYNTIVSAQLIMAFSHLHRAAKNDPKLKTLKLSQWVSKVQKDVPIGTDAINKAKLDLQASRVQVTGEKPNLLFYSFNERGYDKHPPKEKIEKNLEIHRKITNKKGKLVNEVQAGDEINVTLRIRTTHSETVPYVVLVDLFPAGFEFIRESLGTGRSEYIDAREDRLVVYLNATPEVQEVTYQLKATHKGRYTLPGVYGTSMYDPDVQYRDVHGQIEVK